MRRGAISTLTHNYMAPGSSRISLIVLGLSMCACPTKSSPRGLNTVEEQQLQMWHVLNIHKCVLLGKEFRVKGLTIAGHSLHGTSNQ